MKKRVILSAYCWIISSLSIALICGVFVYTLRQSDHELTVWILGLVVLFLLFSVLFYMPVSISVDAKNLCIRRPLRTKRIPLSEITDVKLCQPTMGALRIVGSGGWFGWYGWFRENDLGRYFAYYGKASDCFIVTLSDGSKYMLGCEDAPHMVEAICSEISAHT